MCKIKYNHGSAMVMVVCMTAIITVLSMAMLLSASVVISSANNKVYSSQCHIMAVSLSKEIDSQMLNYDFTSLSKENEENDGSMWFYIKDGITNGTWPYYNEDERGHTEKYAYRTFKFDEDALSEIGINDKIGSMDDISILMYWEFSNDSVLIGGNTPLHVQVSCTKNGQTYVITSEYTLECTLISDTDEPSQQYQRWVWSLNWRE